MPPSADENLIKDAVQDFSKGLHSDLPLRHFAEFHDQKELKKVVDLHKENVMRKVLEQVWTRDKEEIFSLLKIASDRIHKEVVAEWQTRNRDHRVKSVSFLQSRVEVLCDDFSTALEHQLLLDPEIDLESLKNYVKKRKQIAVSCFESIWKPGNSEIQAERKSKLEKQLQILEEEVFDKHQRNSESKSKDDGNKLLGEVGAILLERSRQLKRYVDKHQGRVSNDILRGLRGMVEEMRDYILNGKGSTLRESHEENFNKLVEVTQDEIKFLTEEAKGNMTAEDVVGYAERFDEKIRSCCCENASDKVPEMLQDMNARVPGRTADPRRCITMQNLLNEFKEEHGDSLDLEQNEAESLTGEGKVDGGNNNGDAALEPSAGRKRKRRQEPQAPRRRFTRSVKETNSGNSSMISGATGPDIPPSKKQRIGRKLAGKITRRADVDVHRRSLRLKKGLGSTPISAQTTFPARRNQCKKKSLRDLGMTEKFRSDVDDDRHPSRIDDDIDQAGNVMSADAFEAPSPLTSSPRSLRTNKESKNRQMEKRSKYAVSRTTRRSVNPRASSEQAEVRSVSKKSIGSKSGGASSAARCSDDKVCPKLITILKGDNPKYVCTVCKRRFKCKKYVKYHGEFCGTNQNKSFKCDECGKRFCVKRELDIHTRVHTGDKPFLCPKCPERFTQKGNLNAHLRGHDSKIPYICKTCNLAFVSTSGLHKHSLTHEGRFHFACCYCNAQYHSVVKLKTHVINHSDERPFKCPECEVSFAKMVILVAHLEQTHCQEKKKAQNLAYDACVAYLLEETKNESYRDMPTHKANSTVVNHVIKKANLRLPPDISVWDRSK